MSRMPFHHVLSRAVNVPLFVHPTTAATLVNYILGRSGMEQMPIPIGADLHSLREHHASVRERELRSASDGSIILRPNGGIDASRFAGDMVKAEDGSWRSIEPFLRTKNGVGIISTVGELVDRGAWVGADSGLVSYEGINHQFTRAGNDPKTKVIVYDMASPGGSAAGNAELSRLIASIAAVKPVYAIANNLAASAGYGAIAGATAIVATPSALVGSIGCIMVHMDQTKAAADKGIVPTLIYAGAHKADGHPLASLTPDALDELRRGVNSYYDLFVDVVAAGRKASGLKAKAIRDTEARTYLGKEAKEVGLVDAVGTFEDLLETADKKAQKLGGGSGGKPNQVRGYSQMSVLNLENDQQPRQAIPGPAVDLSATLCAVMDHQAVKANPALLAPALDLARQSPGMSADAVIGFVSRLVPAGGQPQQAAPQPAPVAPQPPAPPAPQPAPAAHAHQPGQPGPGNGTYTPGGPPPAGMMGGGAPMQQGYPQPQAPTYQPAPGAFAPGAPQGYPQQGGFPQPQPVQHAYPQPDPQLVAWQQAQMAAPHQQVATGTTQPVNQGPPAEWSWDKAIKAEQAGRNFQRSHIAPAG